MSATLKWAGYGLIAAVLALGAYQSWRVGEARAVTRDRIDAIIATADPGLKALPGAWIDAMIRIEDPTFRTNDGIDLSSPGAGWTTITQGLAKRIYFDSYTPGVEKLELMLIARFALTGLATKDEILTAFLAAAYLGHKDGEAVIGFPAGARAWFGKEITALTEREFLTLVALLPAPNGLHPIRNPQGLADRVARIERLLAGSCVPAGWRDTDLEGCAAAG